MKIENEYSNLSTFSGSRFIIVNCQFFAIFVEMKLRFGIISKYIGMVLLLDSVFMLASAAISWGNGMDSGFVPLILSFALTAVLGAFPMVLVGKPNQISSKEGYVIVTGAWLLSCVVGMMPYLIWGGEFGVLDAWFESVSGFTTTGATILNDIEALPESLLFWRSSTQWIGGMGVVMFALTVLPSLGKNKMTLSGMEMSPLAKDNFKYRTQKIVRILLYVYIGMTAVEAVLLKVAGMSWFDAVNHSFTTIATGGFSTRNLSIAAYDSLFIEGIITFFTFLSGIHFGLIFATLIGSRNNMFRSEVVRYYFLCILASAVAISVSLWLSDVYGSLWVSLRHGVFQTVSIITTTGFATADTTLWTPLAMALLFFLTLQCASAGSTSGGIKADRVLLSFKVIKTRIRQQQHPNAIFRIKLGGVTQEESTISFAMLYIVIYIFIVLLGTIVNTAAGADFITGLTSAASCMGNVGPGFGEVGSLGNFASIPDFSKFTSTILMLLGRLEIFGLIQLFLIKWWI